ncbi:MAG TPA: hypothetical protein VEC76_00490 [Streptosporangiaceae bacterium]|nr:hypothetical protein [Streptosporangiaceae bacterium]
MPTEIAAQAARTPDLAGEAASPASTGSAHALQTAGRQEAGAALALLPLAVGGRTGSGLAGPRPFSALRGLFAGQARS